AFEQQAGGRVGGGAGQVLPSLTFEDPGRTPTWSAPGLGFPPREAPGTAFSAYVPAHLTPVEPLPILARIGTGFPLTLAPELTMDSIRPGDPAPAADADPAAAPAPSPSLPARAVAVFVRPTRAWDGLRERTQWWFPLLIFMLISIGSGILLYDRAILPAQEEQISRQVANGQMDPQQAERAETMMSNPIARTVG